MFDRGTDKLDVVKGLVFHNETQNWKLAIKADHIEAGNPEWRLYLTSIPQYPNGDEQVLVDGTEYSYGINTVDNEDHIQATLFDELINNAVEATDIIYLYYVETMSPIIFEA